MVALAALLPCQEGSVPAVEVRGVNDDSRSVEPGELFLAVAGAESDGLDYIAAAVQRGAVAVLAERAPAVAPAVPLLVVPDLKRRRGEIAARCYGRPSDNLRCVGITGTNGKTSVACYLADMLSQLRLRVGYMGTIGWGEPGKLRPAPLTTAGAITTQKRLARLLADGAQWVAMEVSSHALDQDRIAGIRFDTGVFTNLSRDHLDYHADLDSYGAAKARLFELVDTAVINGDDAFGRQLISSLAGKTVLSYGTSGMVRWRDLRFASTGVSGSWETPWGSVAFELPLVGEYSVANMSAAVAVLCNAGFPLSEVVKAAERVAPVPGRVEFFAGEPGVVVDFAHTPDALDKVLRALRPHVSGRLICVFGCGGDRDAGKRPLMAQVAEQLADVVWLTSDNPRSEDPSAIVGDIRAGLSGMTESHECIDRREAIVAAVNSATVDDLVVVAGKGHEDYQEVSGQRLPFSDRDVVRELLAAAAGRKG